MSAAEAVELALLVGGAFFFLAGTVGVLRFPDTLCRLHALTKADNVGLGLVTAGLMLEAASLALALKLLTIWITVLLGSSTACYLIAKHVHAAREDTDDHG